LSDFYLIAKIRKVADQDGFLFVESYSDYFERFAGDREVLIDVYGDKRSFFIEDFTGTGENYKLKFKNFNSADEAKFLLGKSIFVDIDNLAELEEDTYFIHDLIGSQVFRNSELVGSVIDVLRLESNDVYVIKSLEGEEILIPAIKDYIAGFNPDKKRLDLVPGKDSFYYEDED
jgi:16S rRNA processing protein RimM